MSGTGPPSLPEGWVVWSDEGEGRAVYAYRPDIFEGQSFPAECLPTIYVSTRPPTQRRRRAGQVNTDWHVSLFLEPEVRVKEWETTVESRAEAISYAVDVAEAFAAGEIDVRSAYQLPRDEYLEELEGLTGRDA